MRFYNANRNENKFLVLGYECEYKISITKKIQTQKIPAIPKIRLQGTPLSGR